MMYCYSMIPVLKRLYGNDEEKMADALCRHLEFMSCTPHLVTLLMGITGAMEEENAKDENFDAASISAVKNIVNGTDGRNWRCLFLGNLIDDCELVFQYPLQNKEVSLVRLHFY